MPSILIKNIGTLVSGNIESPLLDADTLYIENGRIAKIGSLSHMPAAEKTVDAAGAAVTPGLIDSHCHPVLGDFTPRQKQLGFLDSELHGGVTTIISAGEVHLPGRPKDPAGVKALAVLAAKSFSTFRPGGVKVVGGAVILEQGLTEADFKEMAAEGVRTVGEIGLGSVKTPDAAAPMVKWARAAGMTVMMHTGGTSIPGSSVVTADMVMQTDPDIASHVNGGPTAISIDEATRLVAEGRCAVELVHCGNPRMTVETAKICLEKNALHRVIIGNDAPSGTGVVPLGILRVLNMLAALTPVSPEKALCMATGNTARVHKLDCGRIAEGRPADLVIMDAPMGSAGDDLLSSLKTGDVPGVGMVIADGDIIVEKSRNTPPPKRKPQVIRQA
jgi:enamidase